jgi:RNA binding exosome subunit
MFRSLYGKIYLKFAKTEALLSALELMDAADPVKAGVNIDQYNKSRRRIGAELIWRDGVNFHFSKDSG